VICGLLPEIADFFGRLGNQRHDRRPSRSRPRRRWSDVALSGRHR
jgi:hypothetical protein